MNNNDESRGRNLDSLFGDDGFVDTAEGSRSSMEPVEFEEDSKICLHFNGGTELDSPLRLRTIQRRSPDDYRRLVEILGDVVGRYMDEIENVQFSASRRYISQVICFENDEHGARCMQRLRAVEHGYPGQFLLYVNEGDHLHIVHDCPHSNGTCRCSFNKGDDFRGPNRSNIRQVKYIGDLTSTDWANVLLYFGMRKRMFNPKIWIAGTLQEPPSRREIIRWGDLQRESRAILAREQNPGIQLYGGRGPSGDEDDTEDVQTGVRSTHTKRSADSPAGGKKKVCKFETVCEKVSALLDVIVPIPATDLKNILINDKVVTFLMDPNNTKYYEAACEIFQRKFNTFTLKDFANFYEGKVPIFYANDKDPFTYYHNIDDSVMYLNRLIRFQFDNNDEEIVNFLNNVRDWFDKKGWGGNPKVNALCVVGKPNAGKNYFWDTFAAIAYNVGHIGRVNNKTNQFALQECYMRRFIMGNEVSMEDGAKEDFKKLCEGTSFNIRVKYQGDKIYTRAPVCLISNYMLPICSDFHFKNVRLHTMVWETYAGLKESDKKPYPLAIFALFNLYNVEI